MSVAFYSLLLKTFILSKVCKKRSQNVFLDIDCPAEISLEQLDMETLEKKQIRLDLVLLYGFVYGFCNLNASDFISFLYDMFNTCMYWFKNHL